MRNSWFFFGELNRTGITFKIIGSNDNSDGIYSLFLGQQIHQTISINGKELTLALRRERTYLPFTLKLNDFNSFNFHPLINTATININKNDFYNFFKINNIIINLIDFDTYDTNII